MQNGYLENLLGLEFDVSLLAFRRQCGQERSVLVVQGMWML